MASRLELECQNTGVSAERYDVTWLAGADGAFALVARDFVDERNGTAVPASTGARPSIEGVRDAIAARLEVTEYVDAVVPSDLKPMILWASFLVGETSGLGLDVSFGKTARPDGN